ncbi:MAG TPA: chemotaxis protein CheB [Oculatellaceae cyanobacterium]
MPKRDIVVIGASAGGIETCRQLLKLLPVDFKASVFVVIHLAASAPSVLPRILARDSLLPVKNPQNGEVPVPGVVYVAPANQHMILKPNFIQLGRGPRENGCRPSVNALFRTAAFSYGERVVGIIMSGALNDGTAGLMNIKGQGGVAIVQKPEEALFPGMPLSALEFVDVDYVLGISDIAGQLISIVDEPVNSLPALSQNSESHVYEAGAAGLREGMEGTPSHFSCPSCGGVLWQSALEDFQEYKCHVGHAFTTEALLQEQSDLIDTAFWRTLRQLEENIALRRKLLKFAKSRHKEADALALERQLQLAERQAETIRIALLSDVARLSDSDTASESN